MTGEPEIVLTPEPETILDLFKPETRKVDECFDCFTGEPESAVTEIFPKIFADNRGLKSRLVLHFNARVALL